MAGSPGGREVGRLSVKVLPDTSEFGERLQAVLDRIEASAQLAVKVVPDTSRFAEDLATDLQRIRARLDVRVGPDTSTFAEQLALKLANLRAKVNVPVVPDTRKFPSELRERLRAIPKQTVEVNIRGDFLGFRRELRSRLRSMGRAHSITVRAVPDFNGFAAALQAKLRGVKAPEIPVRPVVHPAEIARLRRELAGIRPPIGIPVRLDPTGSSINALRQRLASLADGSKGINAVSAALRLLPILAASAIPSVVSLGAALAQMAPAAGLAATGLMSMVTAGAALRIGLLHVGDAIQGDAEAMRKLAPSAREFVTAVRGMQDEFNKLRLDVQSRLFKGLGDTLAANAKIAMPIFSRALGDAADSLNRMGKQILNTVGGLGKSGALGKALDSATKGLSNMAAIPSVIVQGIVQIAAAAGPAFDRLTARAGATFEKISEKLTDSFQSGRMTQVIEAAIDKVGQLWEIIKNVAGILANIFGPAAKAGGDFLSTLQRITGEIRKVTGTREMQQAFSALFQTLAKIGSTAAPLVGDALRSLAPVVTALADPVQRLVGHFGNALSPILKALGPVLKTLAEAFGGILDAVSPLLEPLGRLVSELVSGLEPIFRGVGTQAREVAKALSGFLQPILERLPGIVSPIVDIIGFLIEGWSKFGAKIWREIQPALKDLGESLGRVLEAMTPILDKVKRLTIEGFGALGPVVGPLIELIGQLASLLVDKLAVFLESVVVPALEFVAAILGGDFNKAWSKAKEVIKGFRTFLVELFQKLPGEAWKLFKELEPKLKMAALKAMDALRKEFGKGTQKAKIELQNFANRAGAYIANLPSRLASKGQEAMNSLVSRIRSGVGRAASEVGKLPGRARSALGGIGGALVSAGASLISGFISGMRARIGGVLATIRSMASSAVSTAKSILGIRSPSTVFAAIGQDINAGLVAGLRSSTRDVLMSLAGMSETLARQVDPSGFEAVGKSMAERLIAGIEDSAPKVRKALEAMAEVPSWSRLSLNLESVGSVRTALTERAQERDRALVTIEHFNALDMSPDDVARALEWKMRARG